MGRGTVLAKFDVQGAFRTIPVYPDDRRLLGMRWQVDLCGKIAPLRDQVASEVV